MCKLANLIEKYIDNYCSENNYTTKKSEKDKFVRIDISNIKEKINLSLYKTGSLVVGGSPKYDLYKEFNKLKEKFEKSPDILGDIKILDIKSVANKYNILLDDVREKIKTELSSIADKCETTGNPTPSEEFRMRLTSNNNSLSITQYKNGTLLLQGKDDLLFHDSCDIIEKIATPNNQEVITRFIAFDEKVLEDYVKNFTPELTTKAEKECRLKVNDVFEYLEPHDKKWLVASESLRIVNVPLPEYSPIVMPAAKSFEGFNKKLLTNIGFYPPNYFDRKSATFSNLNNTQHGTRLTLEAIENHAGTYLNKIHVCLDTNRNFMMHSDGSTITKIDTFDEASKKLDKIYDDMLDIYKYFNDAGFSV